MRRRCPPYKVTDEDLRMIAESGRTVLEASQLTGMSRDMIWKRAKKAGIKFRQAAKHYHDKSRRKEVVKLWRLNCTRVQIACQLGISETAVRCHISAARRLGLITGHPMAKRRRAEERASA